MWMTVDMMQAADTVFKAVEMFKWNIACRLRMHELVYIHGVSDTMPCTYSIIVSDAIVEDQTALVLFGWLNDSYTETGPFVYGVGVVVAICNQPDWHIRVMAFNQPVVNVRQCTITYSAHVRFVIPNMPTSRSISILIPSENDERWHSNAPHSDAFVRLIREAFANCPIGTHCDIYAQRDDVRLHARCVLTRMFEYNDAIVYFHVPALNNMYAYMHMCRQLASVIDYGPCVHPHRVVLTANKLII
jgi:hypothetical protein